MAKMHKSLNKILFLGLLALLGSLFIIVYLIIKGNADEVYTDVVLEYTARFSSNKSAERQLIYILTFAGIIIYSIYYFILQRKDSLKKEYTMLKVNNEASFLTYSFCFLGTMLLTQLFVYQTTNQIFLVLPLFILAVLYYIDKTVAASGLCFYYLSLYSLQGLYRLYVWCDGETTTNYNIIALITIVLLVYVYKQKNGNIALNRAILIMQFFIPFLWLTLLQSKYKFNDEIVTVDMPAMVKIFVAIIMCCCLVKIFMLIKKCWKSAPSLNEVISIGSCITILAYNNINMNGVLLPTDMHHPFENIIGYSQVFESGQKIFSEYIPVSGMYSIVHGAIFKLFGNGLASNYYISTNILYCLVVIAIVLLLSYHLDKSYILLLAVCFYVQDYNRTVLILPLMLLLTLPTLIERKNLWLKIWFLSSFVHGLYYPVCGAAVCIGFLPLGIYQAYTYFKSGKLKAECRTVKFWLTWLVCFIPVLCSMPVLYGTFQHISAMSSQTIYADGIARFGQIVPNSFWASFNEHQSVRLILYYIFTFLIPALFVWVAMALALDSAQISFKNRTITVKNPQTFCMVLSLVIVPMITYSYTIVRLDINSILARSLTILLYCSVMMLVFMGRYIKERYIKYAVCCFVVFILSVSAVLGFNGNENKLTYFYTVPGGYVYVENDAVKKLGTGFIDESLYNTISSEYEIFSARDFSGSYFGLYRDFGYFYLFDAKGAAVIEASRTIKGFGAAQETIDVLRKTRSIVGRSIYTFQNYYLYHWLMTSGNYIWSDKEKLFMPAVESMTAEEIKAQNKNVTIAAENLNLTKYPASLGLSMKSLNNIFAVSDVKLTLNKQENSVTANFSEVIDGKNADWLYIEFADMEQNFQYTLFNLSGEVEQTPGNFYRFLMKKNYNPGMVVIVSWLDDDEKKHCIKCDMSKGKLLVPLGAGAKWLLHNHDNIVIQVEFDGSVIEVPNIENIRLLKLREIN